MSDRNTEFLQPSLAILDSNTNPHHVSKLIQSNGADEENSKQQKCGQWYRDLLSDSPVDSDGLKLIHGNKSLVVKIASFESKENVRDLISKILRNKKKINGIVIAGIEGAFKEDYFKQIEVAIREIKKLKMIVIFQTNLGRPHIQILRTMLWYKRENLETIILFKNSIDGFDFVELFAREDFNINDLTSLRELEIRLQPGMQKLKSSQFKDFLKHLESKYQGRENQLIEHQNHKSEVAIDSEVLIDKISISDQNIGLIKEQKGSAKILRIINEENGLIDRNPFLSLSLSSCFYLDYKKQGLQFLGEVLVSENFDDFIKLDLSEFNSSQQNYWFSLFKYFQTQKSLLELNLSHCTLPEDLSFSLFSNDFSILKLNLYNTNFSENIVSQLLRFLLLNEKCVITNLIFDGSSLTKPCIDKLKDDIIKLNQKQEQNSDLKFQSTLQHLDIYDLNGINSEESEEFFAILFDKVKDNLQSLSLRNCDNKTNQILGLSRSFEKVFSSGQSLRAFQDITVTGIKYSEKQDLKELFHSIMQKHHNISKINFSNCQITDELISSFMDDYQQSNKSLKVLILRSNKKIGRQGYKLIGQNLLFSIESNLQELDISNNNIKKQLDELLKQAEVLNQQNTKLQSWKMNENKKIGKTSFSKLCKYILFSPLFNLKQISLEETLDNKEDLFFKILKGLQQKKYISQSLEVIYGLSNSFKAIQLCYGVDYDGDIRDKLHFIFPKLQKLWFECGEQGQEILFDFFYEKQPYPYHSCLPINEINIKITQNNYIAFFKDHLTYLFENRRLVNLERISISGLEDQEFLKLLFDEVVKDKNGGGKNKSIQQQNQLKKLNLKKSNFQIDDFFQNLIFSNHSKIEELEFGFDYKSSFKVFTAYLATKLNQKQNEFDKHCTYLVALNFNKNDSIDLQEWKQFFQLFIGKKDLSLESPSHSNLRTSQRDTDQQAYIYSKLEEIAVSYKDQLCSLNIGLDRQIQWDPFFSLLGLEVNLSSTSTNLKIQMLNKLVFKTSNNLEIIVFYSLILKNEDNKYLIQAVNTFCEQQKDRNNENKKPFLKIKRISLRDCREIDSTEIMSNFLFHEDLWSLEYLQLKSCEISQEGWNQMCEQTQQMLQLQRQQNGSDFSNIREIKLKELDLSDNPEIKQIFLPQYQIFPKLESIIPDPIDQNQEDLFYQQITKIRQDKLKQYEFEQCLDKFSKVSSISCSYYSNLLVKKIRQNDQFEELILTSAKMTFQELEKLVVLAATNIHGWLILKDIEIVKDPSQDLGQNDITALNPCYNNLLGTNYPISQLKVIFISIEQNQVIQAKTRELLLFIAKYCLSLQELKLQMSDLFKDDDFEAFCKEYSQNKQIKLEALDLSGNKYIKSWSTFFECILCDDSKNSLKGINLSDCNFSQKDFEKLAACARKMKGKIEIDVFQIQEIKIQGNSPNTFSEYFFKQFVLLDSVKIKRLDVSESFDLSEVGIIHSLLNQHSQSNKCTLVEVRGDEKFEQIILKKFGFQNSHLDFQRAYDLLESQEFERFCANALVSPSVKSIYLNYELSSKIIDRIPNKQFDFVKDFLFLWSNLNKIKISLLEENKRSNKKVKPAQVGVDTKEKGPDENTTDKEILSKELFFDLQILQGLELYFNLNRDLPNEYKNMDIPYPYNLVLNPFLLDFLKDEIEKGTKIPLISQIYFTGLDQSRKIETKHVCSLFELFKDTNIDTIYLPYELVLSELPESICSSEKNLIELILMFPPSSFKLENVSVSALKVIYSIQSTNVFFQNCTVGFSSDSFINNGIAYSSRESLIAGKISRNFFKRLFKPIIYFFLDIFCTESRIYKYDDSIPKMNTEFQNNRLYFRLMIGTSYVYYLICVLAPSLLRISTTENSQSDSSSTKAPGIQWYSDLIYLLFAIGTLILERHIFSYIYEKMDHLIPPLIDDSSTEVTSTSFWNCINMIIQKMKGVYFKIRKWLATHKKKDQLDYYLKLLLSQIDRLDMYQDVCFIVECFQEDWSLAIGYIGMFVIALQIALNLFKLTVIFVKEVSKQKKQRLLNTHEINQFCELSNLLEFEAVNEALDIVSPYNVSFIPDNCLTRFLFPNNIGQSYSNRISVCLQKLMLEDLIQIVLKVFYIILQPSDGSNGSTNQSILIFLSFTTNVISMAKSFYKVMSMRPSTISQMEFDNLSKKINSKEMKEKTEEKMEGFKKGLFETIHEVAKDYKNLISYESDSQQQHSQFLKNNDNITHENYTEQEPLKNQEDQNLPSNNGLNKI